MNNIVKTISTKIKDSKRYLKFLRFGKSDVQECLIASSFGVDASPVEDMVAIYASTSNKSDQVIIGFVNKHQLSKVGERRTFSTNENGDEVSFYIHQKNDGTCEIGGNSKHMVRFEEMESAFNQLKSDFNNHVSAYNSHTHITTATVGPSPTPGVLAPTPSASNPSSADVSGAKIEEIKTL